VQLTSDLPRAGGLNRRGMSEDKPPGLASDLVLVNPRTGPAGAHANAEARNVIVEDNLIGDANTDKIIQEKLGLILANHGIL
jgi:hypothetical protein